MISDLDLACVEAWSRCDWTRVAASIATGELEKPEMMGSSLGADSPFPPRSFVEVWSGKGILVGTYESPRPEWYVCKWSTVRAWARGFAADEAARIGQIRRDFYGIYAWRDDEEYHPRFGRQEADERRARYDARMDNGGSQEMARLREEFQAAIRPHLMRTVDEPVVVDGEWAMFDLAVSR